MHRFICFLRNKKLSCGHFAAMSLGAGSDFLAAMKFARREGAQLFLVPLGYAIKETMRDHSDLIIDFKIWINKAYG